MTDYWSAIEPYLETIDIYEGPRVFLKTMAKAPNHVGLLYAAHWCYSEVCNGGFHQFFSNSTGVLEPEAAKAFRLIGMPRIAKVVERASKHLGRPYPRDRAKRQRRLKLVSKPALDKLDDQFFKLIETENGGFEKAADKYAARAGRRN